MNDLPTATVHNSVGHLRADAWSSLADLTHRLAAQGADGRPDTTARIRELIDLLAPVEHCWAFPGTAALKELRALHDQREYRQLADRAEEFHRALAGHRHRPAAPHTAAGPDAVPEGTTDPAHPLPAPSAPYFEVLVRIVEDLEERVGGMSPHDRAAHDGAVTGLDAGSAALPDFSAFHPAFRPSPRTPRATCAPRSSSPTTTPSASTPRRTPSPTPRPRAVRWSRPRSSPRTRPASPSSSPDRSSARTS